MIRFENTEVFNFEGAIRGMRNPLNSWEKSDSNFDNSVKLGENDLKLARTLIKAGSDHRKFLRQIMVSVDITAPLYWWKEFDTYKVGTVANSCSTMHTITDRYLRLDDFSYDYFTDMSEPLLLTIIKAINFYIDIYNNDTYSKETRKVAWYQIIQMLPSSYNQKRTVALNYENIRSMYSQRKNHKLDEWSEGFIGWAESLPYSEFIKE